MEIEGGSWGLSWVAEEEKRGGNSAMEGLVSVVQ